MLQKNKGILDNVQVKEQGYPIGSQGGTGGVKSASIGIVSHCPSCGSPIYGPQMIAPGELPAIYRTIYRTCGCAGGGFQATIHSK